MTLFLRRRAREDIAATIDWYNRQAPELGARFLLEIEQILARIKENPLLYAAVYKGTRRARLSRFPYGIFYRQKEEVIYVIAVTHDARDPGVWQRRR